jgi:hypothetical protein
MMKKILTIFLLLVFLASCGPKRMSCYGKRCVDVSGKAYPKQKAIDTADKKA